VVLLGSFSHLCTAGTEHYLSDWVKSRWWIRERLGEYISVLPLAPVWIEGLKGRSQIRSLFESLTWFSALNATEAVLMKDIFKNTISKHFTCIAGSGWVADRQCFRLPAGLDTRATIATVSDGWNSWPDSVPPLSQAAEKEYISSLLVRLNEAFELNLDLDPCYARRLADINEQRDSDSAAKLIVVIGGSHAANTAKALELAGANVLYITSHGWKLSADGVKVALESLNALDMDPDLILLQVLDNNSFFVAKDDGSLSLPVKGSDKKFHITGDLRVATKDQTGSILKTVKPLLDIMPSVTKIMILPVPRYCYSRCCEKAGHVANFKPELVTEIRSGLNVVKKAVRTYLFKEKFKGASLIDLYSAITDLGPELYADPVHLKQGGYDGLATRVREILAGSAGGDSTADPALAEQQNKRIRILSMGAARGSGTRGPSAQFRGGTGRGGRAGYRGGRGQYGLPCGSH
jgi:hypothetical protein